METMIKIFVKLWSSGNDDIGPIYSPVSLEEPSSPDEDDYDDVGIWKARPWFWKQMSKIILPAKQHFILFYFVKTHHMY